MYQINPVSNWIGDRHRVALIADSSIAAKSILAGKQYNGSEASI